MELFLLLLVPLFLALAGFLYSAYRQDSRYAINIKEFLVLVGVVSIVIVLGYFAARMTSMRDREIWNGRIVEKERQWTSCSHSYPCNPYPCNCDKDGCDICWNTCYEHGNDWNWVLQTSNSETIYIHRVDSQGAHEPPRFTRAKISDPSALTHGYENYIKANPWSLLRRHGLTEKFKEIISEYPLEVRDYHFIDRFLSVKVPVKDIEAWNNDLTELNAELGKKKEVNIIFIAVPTPDSSYIHALEEAWLGGKKNDFVVVFGVTEYPKIDWVRVMSWTRVEELKIALRDELQNIGTLEKRQEIIAKTAELVDRQFVRTRMREFEYLAAGLRPPLWAMVTLFILGIGLSVGLTIYFWKNDPFGTR